MYECLSKILYSTLKQFYNVTRKAEDINLNIMTALLSRRSNGLLFLHVKAIDTIDTPHLTYIDALTRTIIVVIGGTSGVDAERILVLA